MPRRARCPHRLRVVHPATRALPGWVREVRAAWPRPVVGDRREHLSESLEIDIRQDRSASAARVSTCSNSSPWRARADPAPRSAGRDRAGTRGSALRPPWACATRCGDRRLEPPADHPRRGHRRLADHVGRSTASAQRSSVRREASPSRRGSGSPAVDGCCGRPGPAALHRSSRGRRRLARSSATVRGTRMQRCPGGFGQCPQPDSATQLRIRVRRLSVPDPWLRAMGVMLVLCEFIELHVRRSGDRGRRPAQRLDTVSGAQDSRFPSIVAGCRERPCRGTCGAAT